jgi:hypothetical protein
MKVAKRKLCHSKLNTEHNKNLLLMKLSNLRFKHHIKQKLDIQFNRIQFSSMSFAKFLIIKNNYAINKIK